MVSYTIDTYKKLQLTVLILVVMDNGLVPICIEITRKLPSVLILVVVDNGLVLSFREFYNLVENES